MDFSMQVRIAAAYALANGAADAKRRRDANRTAQEACQQQTTDTEGAAPVSAEAAHSGASTAIPSNEFADMSNATSPEEDSGSPQRSARLLQTQPNTPHPYRINPEFYRAGSSGSTGAHPFSGPWYIQHLVRLAACLVSPSLSMHTRTQYSAFDPFVGRQASSQPCAAGRDVMWSGLI